MSKFIMIASALMMLCTMGASAMETTSYRIGQEIPFIKGQPAPSPAPGYAWCLEKRKAVFDTIKETVTIREASWYYESVPPVYASRMEKVMVEPARQKAILVAPAKHKVITEKKMVEAPSVEYRTTPAQYRMVDEEVIVTPARTEKIYVPAQYETYTERVLVRPARTVREEVPGCDEDGGKIDCYASRTIPAEYKTITKKRLVTPARSENKIIPAEKSVMQVRKVVTPASVKKVEIPARYTTVTRKVLVSPEQYRYETIPAKYSTIERKVVVKPEGRKRVEIPAKTETLTRTRVVKPERLVWVYKRDRNVSTACPIDRSKTRSSSTRYSSPMSSVEVEEVVDVDEMVTRYGHVPGTTTK